jgi:NADPH-dependent ferric siderophore reductase
MRHTTPSAFDTGRIELEIDIALHGLGPASSRVARAPFGDVAEIDGLRGSITIVPDHAWRLLEVGASDGAD